MTTSQRYQQCLEEMYGLHRFGIILGLDVIRDILERLGNPHEGMRVIHVAGTNGKGSVASALSSILYQGGRKVGLFTSPHLVFFNERIRINEKDIDDDSVVDAYEAVKAAAAKGTREPTFFEYSTAMALYAFGKRKLEWAVMETGMGGRLDATNIVSPEACVITNISLEHKFYLGKTLAEIAGEKGGIIKPGVPVVTCANQKGVLSVFQKIADRNKASLYRFGKDFRTVRNKRGTFTYYGLDGTWRNLNTGMNGVHQVQNAALALAVCELLNRGGADISLDRIIKGLKHRRWPGRLEVVSAKPPVILDGAHNLAAADKLSDFLTKDLYGRDITLVIGILDDKPYEAMLRKLLPACHRVIFVQPRIDRSLPPETLVKAAKKIGIENWEVIPDVAEAYRHALRIAPDVVCVAGSLYVVGEVKEAIADNEAK